MFKNNILVFISHIIIFLVMKTENYSGDQEIHLTRKAILDLIDSKDWDAVALARKDLFSMLHVKETWLNQ